MRKLRRRLLRWERYAAKTGHKSPRHRWSDSRLWLHGHIQALDAIDAEQCRRDEKRWAGFETDDGCCTLHGPGHDGPCVWYCSWCSGDGRCPGCDGWDDMGCDECGGSLACQYCDGKGEFVDELPTPRVVTEHGFDQAGLL